MESRLHKYKCMDCEHEFIHKNADGLNCPICKGCLGPIGYAEPGEKENYNEYKKTSTINYKNVLEKQIKELEMLQAKNMKYMPDELPFGSFSEKVDAAVRIAEEIRLLCEDARKILSPR